MTQWSAGRRCGAWALPAWRGGPGWGPGHALRAPGWMLQREGKLNGKTRLGSRGARSWTGEGGGVSPASRSRCRPSGWGGAVSLECPASCRASSWARKSISSSSLGWGKPSPGEGEGPSGGEAPSPSLATPATGGLPRGREGEAHLGASPQATASFSLQAPPRHL